MELFVSTPGHTQPAGLAGVSEKLMNGTPAPVGGTGEAQQHQQGVNQIDGGFANHGSSFQSSPASAVNAGYGA